MQRWRKLQILFVVLSANVGCCVGCRSLCWILLSSSHIMRAIKMLLLSRRVYSSHDVLFAEWTYLGVIYSTYHIKNTRCVSRVLFSRSTITYISPEWLCSWSFLREGGGGGESFLWNASFFHVTFCYEVWSMEHCYQRMLMFSWIYCILSSWVMRSASFS